MFFAMIVRVIYYCMTECTLPIFITHCLLPAASCILVVIFIAFCGERIKLTVIPVVMGVVFFMIKAFDFKTVTQKTFCITLYAAIAVIYSLVLYGVIRTKRVLYFLFGLPFLAHVFIEDMVNYVFASPRPPFIQWLPELSVLLIMAGLFFLSFALERKGKE